MKIDEIKRENSSFKDPDAVVYLTKDKIIRQLNISYEKHYEKFIKSGLYDELKNNELVIEHWPVSFVPPPPTYFH